jgi:hypothetical protein
MVKCKKCGKTFKSDAGLKNHLRDVHQQSDMMSAKRKKRSTLRLVARISMFVVLVVVGIGIVANATDYPMPYLNPPLPQTIVSFSVSWPPSSSVIQNALAFNGSMYLNIFLISNGSIVQGQRVLALATGGMTASFGREVHQVLVTFRGASPCYIPGCGGVVISIGGPPGAILNSNEATPGYPPVTEIGNTKLPVSLGGGIYPIDWQSAGTYYPTITLSYHNGSLSNPYTLTNDPISVAPTDVAISERAGRFEVFLGVAFIVVACVEIGLRYIEKEK